MSDNEVPKQVASLSVIVKPNRVAIILPNTVNSEESFNELIVGSVAVGLGIEAMGKVISESVGGACVDGKPHLLTN
jgi:hypothetical protein